ncbi:universal stress protein [Deinococcus pimensis]|uniref:universal stress protein n=1 Tax=Deinococcus pimensis TaxID=309888 RepID=UPI000485EFAD|nr:universal stress protein [Deinococcus pimensis]
MIRHVLAAVAPGTQGHVVALEAHTLARQLGARLTLLHVLPPPPAAPLTRALGADTARAEREAWLRADWFLAELRRDLHDPAVTYDLRTSPDPDVTAAVADASRELGADLVVVGSDAQPRLRPGFGQRLLRCTHLPVMLVGPALPTRVPQDSTRAPLRHAVGLSGLTAEAVASD